MKIDIILVFFCLILFGLAGLMFIQTQKLTAYTLENKYLYEDVIMRFSQTHSYNNTDGESKYNCINYSRDLVEVLNSLGYDAEVKIVEDGKHMIIKLNLEIEPQTARVLVRGG